MLKTYGRHLQLAVHEAGHCAIILSIGDRIGFVELRRGGGYTEQLVQRPAPDTEGMDPFALAQVIGNQCSRDVGVAVGGAVAEHVLLGRPRLLKGEDRRRFEEILRLWPGAVGASAAWLNSIHEQAMFHALKRAEEIIREAEAPVLALAEALVARKRLTGEEATRILCAAQKPRVGPDPTDGPESPSTKPQASPAAG